MDFDSVPRARNPFLGRDQGWRASEVKGYLFAYPASRRWPVGLAAGGQRRLRVGGGMVGAHPTYLAMARRRTRCVTKQQNYRHAG